MDFLLHNAIATMTGPQFLLLYLVWGAAVAGGVYVVRKASIAGADPAEAQLPGTTDPYLTAFLAGGAGRAVQAALVSMVERGYLLQQGSEKELRILAHPAPPDLELLAPLERKIYRRFTSAVDAKEVQSGHLVGQLDEETEPMRNQLERLGLWGKQPGSPQLFATGALLFEGLGLYRLILSISNQRWNIGFLVILMIAGLIVLGLICRRRSGPTTAGKRYLNDASVAFQHLKANLNHRAPDGGSMVPLAVGLFGASVLSNTAYASVLPATWQSGGCGVYGGAGGCSSSSCGSSSSSCGSSSSSCGSSSCGGGGCGGCGGGGD